VIAKTLTDQTKNELVESFIANVGAAR